MPASLAFRYETHYLDVNQTADVTYRPNAVRTEVPRVIHPPCHPENQTRPGTPWQGTSLTTFEVGVRLEGRRTPGRHDSMWPPIRHTDRCSGEGSGEGLESSGGWKKRREQRKRAETGWRRVERAREQLGKGGEGWEKGGEGQGETWSRWTRVGEGWRGPGSNLEKVEKGRRRVERAREQLGRGRRRVGEGWRGPGSNLGEGEEG